MEAHLRRVYWETTAGCNLRCIHCRRVDVLWKPSPEELSTDQGKALIDQLASMERPVLIFSGGEPLFRKDLFTLASHARKAGLPIALSTNGTLVDEKIAQQIKEAGIYYASISLDGITPETHDHFRGQGNFVRAIRGLQALQKAGIKVQINFTVTKDNVSEVERMYHMAAEYKASALYLFLLVPVGCGMQLADSSMLTTAQVEDWLRWVARKDKEGPLPIKAICAPQYYRVEREIYGIPEDGTPESRKGCLAGIHMCFISHKGDVFPCGYLPVSCGNVKQTLLSEIWKDSMVLRELRDPQLLKGKCSTCSAKVVCGGCRARGYYATQDFLAEEPYCAFEPSSTSR